MPTSRAVYVQVFIDWSCLYQKNPSLWKRWMVNSSAFFGMTDEELCQSSPDGAAMVAERRAYQESRSKAESAALGRVLEHAMDLFYSHTGITVVLLTVLPEKLPEGFDASRTYSSRGWTSFERCSAELAKYALRMTMLFCARDAHACMHTHVCTQMHVHAHMYMRYMHILVRCSHHMHTLHTFDCVLCDWSWPCE